jgi:FMN phosphatase YigB (HAD superfamily)
VAAEKLKVEMENCIVVGESLWDLLGAQRARSLGVGLLCGGSGQRELEGAGAYRVYRDPGDWLAHLNELGVLTKVERTDPGITRFLTIPLRRCSRRRQPEKSQ